MKILIKTNEQKAIIKSSKMSGNSQCSSCISRVAQKVSHYQMSKKSY